MAIIQAKSSAWTTGGGAITLVLDASPTAGNTLIAFLWMEGTTTSVIDTAGWTQLIAQDNGAGADGGDALKLYKALGTAGATVHVPTGVGSANHFLTVYEVDDAVESTSVVAGPSTPTSGNIGGASVTQAEDLGVVIAAYATKNESYQGVGTITGIGALTGLAAASKQGRLHAWSGSIAATTPDTYYPNVTVASMNGAYPYIEIAVLLSGPVSALPVADFIADTLHTTVPSTIHFTDLSTGSPTSWAWTFGDGGTSTSQNPSHTYTVPGIYTVTLTATNAFGSDSETKTAYLIISADVGYEDPRPGLALVEIYAAEAGAPRWDVATWDDAVWSTAAWQNVTPESVEVQILWGSSSPEDGILNRPSAGSWNIVTYDPERILDPANAEGPYFTDLIPYLPVRITHRGLVIRQGYAEGITHNFDDDLGQIRVFDSLSILANSQVPSDTMLSSTLYARAVDAIAASGLGDSIRVLPPPPSGDPDVAAWETGINEWSVWQWIQDAAEQALHVPYIDRIGRVGFRAWANPLSRARTLDESRLVGLTSISQYNGMYSEVRALDSITDTVEVRALTPPPRYGVRTYERSDPTLDAGEWAQAVLFDRSFPGVRWVPGTIYPLTADDVEMFATIEAGELVGLTHGTADPDVLASLIITGGEVRITAKKDDEAKWWFTFHAAQTTTEAGGGLPLTTEDGTGFLLNESETEYLYPG